MTGNTDMIYLLVSVNVTVFALTHLPKAQVKLNWIQTSENYERIFLNKYNFFLILVFGQVGEKN
jgi:hypothetical protein